MTVYDNSVVSEEATTRPWVRWSPSFAGAITAIAVTTMIMAFWLALGYGSGIKWFVHNMQWFFLGTALFGLIVGGVVAGAVARVRGAAVGMIDGLMVWALVLMAALIPLSLRALAIANAGKSGAPTQTALGISSGNMWALFGVLIGGLFCAMVGSLIAGTPRRVRVSYERLPFEGSPRTGVREPTERRVG